jgi:hypothetical protein
MKTAIYIEDGTVQLILTPEGEFEKNALTGFRDKPLSVEIFAGSFYDCRGGWIRQNDHNMNGYYMGGDKEDRSIILRIKDAPHETPAA